MRRNENKWKKMVVSIVLLTAFAVFGISGTALAHGTTSKTIKKSMLKNSPDENYEVNMEMQREASEGVYNDWFLEKEIQTVSIDIDENNLNYLLQNAVQKPYVMTNSVTIGEETIGYAGLKTKGNYTLEHTDFSTSDRFSFTINFGKYIKKENYGVTQNFYGCSKISFNNFFFDKCMMKEYFSMKLMSELGIPTPQYGLAKLYINGEYYGVYFMVEAIDDTIIEQYKQIPSMDGYLAKPYNTKLIYDEELDQYLKEDGTFDLSPVLKQDAVEGYKASGILANQAGLWEEEEDKLGDVAEMLPTVLLWEKRLNQLSEGKDFSGNNIDVNSDEYRELLESIMDTDKAVRYFAVHSFLVQLDSMFYNDRNYGLYVGTDGKCMLLPWDYDLSFGCYYPGNSELTANYWFDTLYWSGKSGYEEKSSNEIYKEYPIFNVIYQNYELMNKFIYYIEDCCKIAFLGGMTSFGKTYEPCWFASYIDAFSSKLEKAASERLADNVEYLNHTTQPDGVIQGLPELKKIIAMRSVSVHSQVAARQYGWVSGVNCDLSKLGNGVPNAMNQSEGTIINVDAETGIYILADYGEGQNQSAPNFSIEEISSDENIYQEIKEAIDSKQEKELTVYKMKNSVTPVSPYSITLPLSMEELEKPPIVYSYIDSTLSKLDMTLEENVLSGQEENLYSGQIESLEYLVVENAISEKEEERKRISNIGKIFGIIIILCIVAIPTGLKLRHFIHKK